MQSFSRDLHPPEAFFIATGVFLHCHPLPLGVDGLDGIRSGSGGPASGAAIRQAGAKLWSVSEAGVGGGFAAEVLEGEDRGLSGPADQGNATRKKSRAAPVLPGSVTPLIVPAPVASSGRERMDTHGSVSPKSVEAWRRIVL